MEHEFDRLTREELLAELVDVRNRLDEAQETLRAIREGEVDAVIVSGSKGDRVFSLTETENLHRLMVETMSEAGIATSPEGTVLFCNQRACTLLGVSQEQILGHAINEFVVSHDAGRIEAMLATAQTTPTDSRILFIAADGTPVPMHVWASPLDRPDGAMIAIVGTDLSQLETDKDIINQLEEQQQALCASEDRLRLFIEHAPAAIAMFDKEMRYLAASRRWLADYGILGQKIIGRSHYDIFPDIPERWKQVHSRCLLGAVERADDDRFERADGSVQWVKWEVRPWMSSANAIGGIIMFTEDITARKRTEEALRGSERLYRAIGESIDYGVWVCALDGRNIYASESFLKMVGITQQQCSDFGWGDVLHPDDSAGTIAAWQECVRTGKTWNREHRFRGVDGQWHHVLARGVPVRDEQGNITCWAGINLDIGDLKRAEEALRESQHQLHRHAERLDANVRERTSELARAVVTLQQEVDKRRAAESALEKQASQLRQLATELTLAEHRERRRLARVLHDDLQQLMAAAKMRLTLLRRSKDEQVAQAAVEADELIGQSIAASRNLAGELSPPILHERGLLPALEWLQRWMKEKHDLTVELAAEQPFKDMGDDVISLMFDSIRELLFNVVKHSKVRTAHVALEQAGTCVRATISDDGVGIDESRLSSLNGEGGSFGLFSIQERFAAMGGRLSIESAPGKGCRLTLLSPPPRPPRK